MAIYAGLDGVVRKLGALKIGQENLVCHTHSYFAGVNGVVRNLNDISEQIDYVEIEPLLATTYTVDYDGNTVSHTNEYGLDAVNKYGSISISTNQIQVKCQTARKQIILTCSFRVVFIDGHIAPLFEFLQDVNDISFSLSVTSYQYFSAEGWCYNYCLGAEVIEDSESGISERTITITEPTSENALLKATLRDDGICVTQQTFNSLSINGTAIPIKIASELVYD